MATPGGAGIDEVGFLRARVSSLEANVATLNDELTLLRGRRHELEGDVERLRARVGELVRDLAAAYLALLSYGLVPHPLRRAQ
jgi:predicted  nucleic acid-binding Zn-ribbon protein